MATLPELNDPNWPFLLSLLPEDLEDSARRTRALVRCRNIPNAAALLRIALAYAVSDLSLKDVAAWARGQELAEMTGPGLFYRLREAEPWLQEILARTLAKEIKAESTGRTLRIVDATVLTGPGATGTEWRVHLVGDPATGKFCSVELTDGAGGEGLARHSFHEGEIVLGDRVYATARGIAAVRAVQADLVVRLNPQILRLCSSERQRFELLREEIPAIGEKTFDLLVPIPPDNLPRTKSHHPWPLKQAKDWIPVHIVAARTRKGEVIWVLTTLDVPAAQVLELYRLRWQVELLFKRLKSLLHLDTLPSRQGPTARSWILARLLAAALAQKLLDPAGALSPWGYEVGRIRLYP
jgi:hypothetical protein